MMEVDLGHSNSADGETAAAHPLTQEEEEKLLDYDEDEQMASDDEEAIRKHAELEADLQGVPPISNIIIYLFKQQIPIKQFHFLVGEIK